MQAINGWLARTMMTAASSPNETGDQTGFVSKAFRISHAMSRYRRRYKAWNGLAYKATKLALVAALLAFIVWV